MLRLHQTGLLLLFLVMAAMTDEAGASSQYEAIPLDVQIPTAPLPVHSGGKTRVLYELHLTNLSRNVLHLKRVEMTDGAGRLLQLVEGHALAASTYEPGIPKPADSRQLPSGRRAVIFMDVELGAANASSKELLHILSFDPVETINLDKQDKLELPPIAISTRPIPIIGPPLRGGCWVASHALSNESSHRRTLLTLNGSMYDAQRFAIDWIRIGADGQAFRSDPSKNTNWSAYGAEVLAVADGIIWDVRDGIPENDPTSDKKAVPIDLETVGGNHILLKMADGVSAFYAHLQPGSIRVRLGQRVRKGQVLGRVGNSGQADAPHLHIHLVAGSSALASEGIPFELREFWLQGSLPTLAVLADGRGWRPSSPPRLVRGEMPAENAVVAFEGAGDAPCFQARK